MTTKHQAARSRSGTATTPNDSRRRKMVTVTLSPEALERLDELAAARAQTRSGTVEAMILRAKTGGRS
jgi:DNA-binding TFAR19-related protein (PDSD5 family)